MKTAVNMGFIHGLEGGPVLTGYVPDPDHSQSGVTIASGFDIGARSNHELYQQLPPKLAGKLSAYTGLRGQAAQHMLMQFPLVISPDDAVVIDALTGRAVIRLLAQRFDAVSIAPFASLPEPAQTVIASVAFQYGDLSRRCPTFWGCAIHQDWAGMHTELSNFGDRYSSRRQREAAYLQGGK